MANELTICQFNNYPIRITLDDNGDPWFVAKDVCDALGLKHVTSALTSIPVNEKGMKKISTPGGMQELNIISEAGRYRLTMKCHKEQAKPFQDWIAKVAMPTIRKLDAAIRSLRARRDNSGRLGTEYHGREMEVMQSLCDCCQRFVAKVENFDTAMGKRFYCQSCADDLQPVDEQHERMMADHGPEDKDADL